MCSSAFFLQIEVFGNDMVLSKIKCPRTGKQPSKNFQLHHHLQFYIPVFHCNFLNLWLLGLGRTCMPWSREQTRNTTRDWIQSDPARGLSILERGPGDCQHRRGKQFRRGLVNLQAASCSSYGQRSSKCRSKLKIIIKFSFRWTPQVVVCYSSRLV